MLRALKDVSTVLYTMHYRCLFKRKETSPLSFQAKGKNIVQAERKAAVVFIQVKRNVTLVFAKQEIGYTRQDLFLHALHTCLFHIHWLFHVWGFSKRITLLMCIVLQRTCSHVHTYTYADMMKLVDISDLGSDEHASWGFKSLYPYQIVCCALWWGIHVCFTTVFLCFFLIYHTYVIERVICDKNTHKQLFWTHQDNVCLFCLTGV